MLILLTNDDGIGSSGINLLADSIRNSGHRVIVTAPAKNRSGCSHCISFFERPIELKKIKEDTYSCTGTPVDCIIVSLLGGIPEIEISGEGRNLKFKNAPDLILSGINAGANLGTDIIYSGTAAAARQGSLFNIPSLALSLVENDGPWQWSPVISYITENLEKLMALWKPDSFVNINFLNSGKKPESLVPVFPSLRYYNDRIVRFTDPDGRFFCFAKTGRADNVPVEGSDWNEVLKNNAVYSVIHIHPVNSQ